MKSQSFASFLLLLQWSTKVQSTVQSVHHPQEYRRVWTEPEEPPGRRAWKRQGKGVKKEVGRKKRQRRAGQKCFGKRRQGYAHPEAHFVLEMEWSPRFLPWEASLYEATGKGQVTQTTQMPTAEIGLIAKLCTVDLKFFSPYDDLCMYWIICCFLPNGSSNTTGNCTHKILWKKIRWL